MKNPLKTHPVVEFYEGLALEGVRGEAARVGRELRVALEPARQPREVAVADEAVVAQLEAAQPEKRLEHVLGQRRQVVVVQRPVWVLEQI